MRSLVGNSSSIVVPTGSPADFTTEETVKAHQRWVLALGCLLWRRASDGQHPLGADGRRL